MKIISLKTILAAMACMGFWGSVQAATLKVVVEGVKEPYGAVCATLFCGEENWLKEGAQQTLNATKDVVEFTFEGVAPGVYGAYAFQDEDNDGTLKTGAFGKPVELYGFSKNARGMFGPAKWKNASFEVKEADIEIRFKVQ